jgi:general secretion pathway protein D
MRLGLLLLLILALGVLAAPARAQYQAETQAQPPAAVLTEVSVAKSGRDEAQVVLSFSPLAPKFSIVGDGTDKPAVAFALSSRGQGARFPQALTGLLRSMAIDQQDSVLIVSFAASGPVKVEVVPVGDHLVAIRFSRGTAQPAAPPDQAASGPLPRVQDRPPGEDGFEVVPLKYADVSEVVGLLADGQTVRSNDTFVPREPAFGSAGMGGQAAFTPVPAQQTDASSSALAQSVNEAIGIDRRLNAVILKGPPDRIARLKAKIAEIDVPVESVILETVFVELDETGAKNVGLDFNNSAGEVAVATFQSGSYLPGGASTGHGQVSASLQAAIFAQVQNGRGHIVSKPRISAQSGSSAKIITGDALPIQTAITLSGVNGVSQQVQYVNVGVTLQIAPRVSDDGYVTSHVFCVVSSVTGYSNGYPTISQREAETSATVRDGETFVIGGLTEETETSTKSHVPVLGSAPLAGSLFRLNQSNKAKTDLYIVVTPHVVRRGAPKLRPVLD